MPKGGRNPVNASPVSWFFVQFSVNLLYWELKLMVTYSFEFND